MSGWATRWRRISDREPRTRRALDAAAVTGFDRIKRLGEGWHERASDAVREAAVRFCVYTASREDAPQLAQLVAAERRRIARDRTLDDVWRPPRARRFVLTGSYAARVGREALRSSYDVTVRPSTAKSNPIGAHVIVHPPGFHRRRGVAKKLRPRGARATRCCH